MAGKKKFAPRKLKSPKRLLPRRSEGGVNPLAVAGGAAVGAAIGRGVARKTNLSRATKATAGEMSRQVIANEILFGKDEKSRNISRASEGVYNQEYRRMPRVKSQAKLDVYRNLVKQGSTPSAARKSSGLSSKETTKYYNKADARFAPDSNADRLSSASYLRHERTRATAGRRGALAGGLSGAAISAIAQLVAKELRKKR